MDWNEEVRARLGRFAKVLNDGIGGMSDAAEDAAAADIRTALRHIDTLTGYVEGWKARAEKVEAELEKLRADLTVARAAQAINSNAAKANKLDKQEAEAEVERLRAALKEILDHVEMQNCDVIGAIQQARAALRGCE